MSFTFREKPVGHKWFLYYWIFSKRFGAECYRTWRQELLASILVSAIAYFLTVRDDPMGWKNFRVVLVSTALTLGAFALWHLLRSPWLLHSHLINQKELNDHWGFGILGIVILAGVLSGGYLFTSYLWEIRSIPVSIKIPAPPAPPSLTASNADSEKQKRLRIRAELGKLLAHNNEIRDNCGSDKPPTGFSCVNEEVRWLRQARSYISKKMEPSYLARFRAATGTHMIYKTPSRWLGEEENNAMNILTISGGALDEFIREFQN